MVQQDKLRKLLMEIDTRLIRARDPILRWDGRTGPANNVVRQIDSIRAEIRRHASKVDTLRLDEVEKIERWIAGLSDTARNRLGAFGDGTPLSGPLRDISEDRIGLMNLCVGLRIGLAQLGPDEVMAAVPGQKTAAFQFDLKDDALFVADQPLRPNPREQEMALAALEAAVEHGQDINEDLAATNASPRLREAFQRLQRVMSAYKNIVQVGSYAGTCNRLLQAEAEEMSSSLFAALIGHLEMVSNALAQFEDWRLFCENAASVTSDPSMIKQLSEDVAVLAVQFRREAHSDPSVSVALETAVAWVEENPTPDKRDVFSLGQTIANLWSLISKSIFAIGKDVVSESRKRVAGILLVILLSTANQYVPIISKFPGAEWIETAYKYLRSLKNDP